MSEQQEYFRVTETELNQIRNDCAYPERETCDECPLVDGEDVTRASGLGCNFKGANALIDEVLSRPISHISTPAPELESIDSANVPEILKQALKDIASTAAAKARQEERKKFEQELKSPCGTISAVCTEKMRQALKMERERLLVEAIEKLWRIPIYPEENPKERIQEMLESLRGGK